MEKYLLVLHKKKCNDDDVVYKLNFATACEFMPELLQHIMSIVWDRNK